MSEEKVILCKRPICGKDSRTIDKRSDAKESLVVCDKNETYKCYNSEDQKRRYLMRFKKEHDIDWAEVERIQNGVTQNPKQSPNA